MSGMFWIALQLSNYKIRLITTLSLADKVTESRNLATLLSEIAAEFELTCAKVLEGRKRELR